MKKSIIALLLITVLSILAQGQEVVIQDSAPFTYAYLECRGPYQQIQAKIGLFMQEFFKQKLMPAGNFFGMYLNSPAEVKEEELQWRLGFPIAVDTAVAAPLQKCDYSYTKVAVLLHVGPYDKVAEAYGKIFAFIEKNGYKIVGPCLEKYLDMNPQAVKPEELRTEIVWPVELK